MGRAAPAARVADALLKEGKGDINFKSGVQGHIRGNLALSLITDRILAELAIYTLKFFFRCSRVSSKTRSMPCLSWKVIQVTSPPKIFACQFFRRHLTLFLFQKHLNEA